MTRSSSIHNTNKPPDPITTTTTTTTTGSLNSSSTLSVSPSTSVLLSSPNKPSSRRPVIPTTSQNTRNTKLEQIIQNFYTKTAHIILQSRLSNERLSSAGKRKINKWFNITTHDCEHLKDELRFWKSFIKNNQEEQPPPLIIDIYLESTLAAEKQKTEKSLIESWTLSLNHPLPDFPVDLPNLYKRSIVFFRSLHSLVRLLPSYKLYKRLNSHDNDVCLGYTLSTHYKSQDPPTMTMDNNNAKQQQYEFKEVVTPLGTFKLKLLYREHVHLNAEKKKSTSLSTVVDVDEHYFTPTMTKYRQEQMKETIKPSNSSSSNTFMYPSTSTSSTKSNRLNSYRNTTNRYPTTSTSSTTTTTTTTSALERRISAPLVQPFKSPSLSFSPQAELMYASRSQTPERPSGSFGRTNKIEFSSSFEKFKNSSSSPSNSSMNRPSNTPTPDIMRRWSRTSDHSSINLEFEENEEDLEDFMKFITVRQELKLFQQQQQQQFTVFTPPQQQQKQEENEDAKTSLTHFKNMQETHTILSDSIFSINQQNKEQSTTTTTSSPYDSPASSLNKVPNLPTKPSPLHNTELLSSPPQDHRHQQRNNMEELFMNYTAHQADIVAQSPLKNRQAPPALAPLGPVRRISGSAVGDDDDSLVFKMSELSATGGEDNTDDYLTRLKKIDTTMMRRVHSSGHIPSEHKVQQQEYDHYSDDGTSKPRQRIYFD